MKENLFTYPFMRNLAFYISRHTTKRLPMTFGLERSLGAFLLMHGGQTWKKSSQEQATARYCFAFYRIHFRFVLCCVSIDKLMVNMMQRSTYMTNWGDSNGMYLSTYRTGWSLIDQNILQIIKKSGLTIKGKAWLRWMVLLELVCAFYWRVLHACACVW